MSIYFRINLETIERQHNLVDALHCEFCPAQGIRYYGVHLYL